MCRRLITLSPDWKSTGRRSWQCPEGMHERSMADHLVLLLRSRLLTHPRVWSRNRFPSCTIGNTIPTYSRTVSKEHAVQTTAGMAL